MNNEKVMASAVALAGIGVPGGAAEVVRLRGRYSVEFYDRSGELKWSQEIQNLVTTVGKNDLLDNQFQGSSYTAAWYLGLVDGASAPTFAAGDSAAAHAGWSEFTGYDNASRPAPAFAAASAGSKSTSQTDFNISADGTVAGCFLINDNTKAGTTGVLYSCGAFSGGDQPVTSGGTLKVTYTAQA